VTLQHAGQSIDRGGRMSIAGRGQHIPRSRTSSDQGPPRPDMRGYEAASPRLAACQRYPGQHRRAVPKEGGPPIGRGESGRPIELHGTGGVPCSSLTRHGAGEAPHRGLSGAATSLFNVSDDEPNWSLVPLLWQVRQPSIGHDRKTAKGRSAHSRARRSHRDISCYYSRQYASRSYVFYLQNICLIYMHITVPSSAVGPILPMTSLLGQRP
jgi:hypothetical protein